MLWPFAWLYGALIRLRLRLYRRGLLKSYSLGVPTISIGNISVGGTGKTPMVAFVAEVLAECGAKVCILTRGYGRRNPNQRVIVSDGTSLSSDPKISGDEPIELALRLRGKAIIVADANRVSAGIWARREFGVSAFVLDDGFQHLRVKRDLDVVTIDATDPFGNGSLLPHGTLREPLLNLRRAEVIVITRANLTNRIDDLKNQVARYNPDAPIFTCENKMSGLVDLREFHEAALRSQAFDPKCSLEINALAFCGLGNPDNFFEQLRRDKFRLVATKTFPDHHYYSSPDIETLSRLSAESNAGMMLTTAKDAVKLKGLDLKMPCFVVENNMVFNDEKKLRKILCAVLAKNS